MSKIKDKRYYKFDVQRNYQYETHNDKGEKVSDITELEWREKIKSEIYSLLGNVVTEIFCIFHDRDVNDDGTSKGLHVHMVVSFGNGNNKTQTSAIKILGASSVHNCQPCHSYVDSLRYLIHISEDAVNSQKYIYDVEDVFGWRVSDDGSVVALTVSDFKGGMSRKNDKKTRAKQKDVKNTCSLSIATGNSTMSDVRELYSEDSQGVGLTFNDYLSDKPMYERASAERLAIASEFYQHNPCPLTSIYIYGGGGTGKTSLANALSEHWSDAFGVHRVSAPGKSTTFDFAGNYRGERVSIFNELSSAFPVEQFLSIFDPLNASPVNSRHFDKLYFANYSIFTTSVPPENFIYNLWRPYAKDNAKIPFAIRDALVRSTTTTEEDWLNAYMQYIPKHDDKILQIRRRIPILVNTDNGFATIYVLCKDFNTSNCFAFSPAPVGKQPYEKFCTVRYAVDDKSCIKSDTAKLVELIDKAIDTYYSYNGYQSPDSFEKPDFSKLLKI